MVKRLKVLMQAANCRWVLPLLLLPLLLSACTGKPASKDTAGLPSSLPNHVVALSRSIGELWVNAGGSLCGITDDGFEIPDLNEDAVSIGTLSTPSLEAILSLSPDLVLLSADIPTHKKLRTSLEDAGVSCYPVDINSFGDYKNIMKALTDLTGRSDLYQKNCLDVGERIQTVIDQSKDLPKADYLAIRVSATKNKALKKNNFACEILSNLQMTNIADGDTPLDELNLEAIAAADPDYIFVIPSGKDTEAMQSYKDAFTEQPVWSKLTAVRNGHVYVLPKDLFQYKPNARWDEAYDYIYELRHS